MAHEDDTTEVAYTAGDRVQWLDVPGYMCGTVTGRDATGVNVDLDCGLVVHVGEYNVTESLRQIGAG